MAVRVDDRDDRQFAEVLVDELLGGGRLHNGEGIDHDPPGVTAYKCDIGDVVPAYLIDAGRHLEETVVGLELR